MSQSGPSNIDLLTKEIERANAQSWCISKSLSQLLVSIWLNPCHSNLKLLKNHLAQALYTPSTDVVFVLSKCNWDQISSQGKHVVWRPLPQVQIDTIQSSFINAMSEEGTNQPYKH